MIGAKASHPNAARLIYDYILSKGKAKSSSEVSREIPVRKDVEPDPPRLFRGFKYVIENPEDYKDFDATVKQYLRFLNYAKRKVPGARLTVEIYHYLSRSVA